MGLQARAHRVAACSTHRAAARSLQHTQGRSLQPVPARECFELCKLDSAAAVDVRIAEHALERIIRHEYAALPERRLELGQLEGLFLHHEPHEKSIKTPPNGVELRYGSHRIF